MTITQQLDDLAGMQNAVAAMRNAAAIGQAQSFHAQNYRALEMQNAAQSAVNLGALQGMSAMYSAAPARVSFRNSRYYDGPSRTFHAQNRTA